MSERAAGEAERAGEVRHFALAHIGGVSCIAAMREALCMPRVAGRQGTINRKADCFSSLDFTYCLCFTVVRPMQRDGPCFFMYLSSAKIRSTVEAMKIRSMTQVTLPVSARC